MSDWGGKWEELPNCDKCMLDTYRTAVSFKINIRVLKGIQRAYYTEALNYRKKKERVKLKTGLISLSHLSLLQTRNSL